MKTRLSMVITVSLLSAPATALLNAAPAAPAALAAAADKGKDSGKLGELQQRFKDRYPAILELKSKGVVGETDDGFLDWVEKKDSKSADLINQENADRKELYKEVAKKEGTTDDVVAKHAAERNLKKAKNGEYVKVEGKWHKKA
jgi:uncharacterized protein YdbL (DUF1318 family)